MQKNILLLATVFLTGMAVLIIEVAAVRILSPYFGSALHVLSGILTIILAALSTGYYVGGKLADKYPYSELLYILIAISGISVLLSELVALFYLPMLGINLASLWMPIVLGFVLFFIPAFLLGCVSPYIIKLQVKDIDSTGSIAGATFFWGTLGSITGSLMTGFVLVPYIGVMRTMIGTGIGLVFLGLLGFFHFSQKKTTKLNSKKYHIAVLFLVTTALALLPLGFTEDDDAIYLKDGLYSQIRIYDVFSSKHYTFRALQRDINHSSVTSLTTYDLLFQYTQFANFYKTLKPDTESFYLIGGGSFSIPRTLVGLDENIEVTVSEIEPSLEPLAVQYFDLHDTSRIHTTNVDGRVFLANSDQKYDVIYGDAFGTDLNTPHHLATQEFFEEVKEHLTPDGIFMLNGIGNLNQEAPSFVGSLTKTIISVFPNTKIYPLMKDQPDEIQNIMYVARNGDVPIDLSDETITLSTGGTLEVESALLPITYFDLAREYLFTDDRAPIEILALKQRQ